MATALRDAADEPAPEVLPWVLLLISDPRLRELARQTWEKAGFGVEVALNADDAAELLSVMTPSLVVVEDTAYRPAGR